MAVSPLLRRKCVWTGVLTLLAVLPRGRCHQSSPTSAAETLVEDLTSVVRANARESAHRYPNDLETVTLRAEDFHNLINALVDTVKLLKESGTKCCSGCESKPMMMPWAAVPMIPMNRPWFTVQPYYLPPEIGPFVPHPPVAPQFVFGAGNGTFYNSKGSWIYPWREEALREPLEQPLQQDIVVEERPRSPVIVDEPRPAVSHYLQDAHHHKIWDLNSGGQGGASRIFNPDQVLLPQTFGEVFSPSSPPSIEAPHRYRLDEHGTSLPWVRTVDSGQEGLSSSHAFDMRNPWGHSTVREQLDTSFESASEVQSQPSQSLGPMRGLSDDRSEDNQYLSGTEIVNEWDDLSGSLPPIRDPSGVASPEVLVKPFLDSESHRNDPQKTTGSMEESGTKSLSDSDRTQMTLLEAVVTESLMFHHMLINTESPDNAGVGPLDWPKSQSQMPGMADQGTTTPPTPRSERVYRGYYSSAENFDQPSSHALRSPFADSYFLHERAGSSESIQSRQQGPQRDDGESQLDSAALSGSRTAVPWRNPHRHRSEDEENDDSEHIFPDEEISGIPSHEGNTRSGRHVGVPMDPLAAGHGGPNFFYSGLASFPVPEAGLAENHRGAGGSSDSNTDLVTLPDPSISSVGSDNSLKFTTPSHYADGAGFSSADTERLEDSETASAQGSAPHGAELVAEGTEVQRILTDYAGDDFITQLHFAGTPAEVGTFSPRRRESGFLETDDVIDSLEIRDPPSAWHSELMLPHPTSEFPQNLFDDATENLPTSGHWSGPDSAIDSEVRPAEHPAGVLRGGVPPVAGHVTEIESASTESSTYLDATPFNGSPLATFHLSSTPPTVASLAPRADLRNGGTHHELPPLGIHSSGTPAHPVEEFSSDAPEFQIAATPLENSRPLQTSSSGVIPFVAPSRESSREQLDGFSIRADETASQPSSTGLSVSSNGAQTGMFALRGLTSHSVTPERREIWRWIDGTEPGDSLPIGVPGFTDSIVETWTESLLPSRPDGAESNARRVRPLESSSSHTGWLLRGDSATPTPTDDPFGEEDPLDVYIPGGSGAPGPGRSLVEPRSDANAFLEDFFLPGPALGRRNLITDSSDMDVFPTESPGVLRNDALHNEARTAGPSRLNTLSEPGLVTGFHDLSAVFPSYSELAIPQSDTIPDRASPSEISSARHPFGRTHDLIGGNAELDAAASIPSGRENQELFIGQPDNGGKLSDILATSYPSHREYVTGSHVYTPRRESDFLLDRGDRVITASDLGNRGFSPIDFHDQDEPALRTSRHDRNELQEPQRSGGSPTESQSFYADSMRSTMAYSDSGRDDHSVDPPLFVVYTPAISSDSSRPPAEVPHSGENEAWGDLDTPRGGPIPESDQGGQTDSGDAEPRTSPNFRSLETRKLPQQQPPDTEGYQDEIVTEFDNGLMIGSTTENWMFGRNSPHRNHPLVGDNSRESGGSWNNEHGTEVWWTSDHPEPVDSDTAVSISSERLILRTDNLTPRSLVTEEPGSTGTHDSSLQSPRENSRHSAPSGYLDTLAATETDEYETDDPSGPRSYYPTENSGTTGAEEPHDHGGSFPSLGARRDEISSAESPVSESAPTDDGGSMGGPWANSVTARRPGNAVPQDQDGEILGSSEVGTPRAFGFPETTVTPFGGFFSDEIMRENDGTTRTDSHLNYFDPDGQALSGTMIGSSPDSSLPSQTDYRRNVKPRLDQAWRIERPQSSPSVSNVQDDSADVDEMNGNQHEADRLARQFNSDRPRVWIPTQDPEGPPESSEENISPVTSSTRRFRSPDISAETEGFRGSNEDAQRSAEERIDPGSMSLQAASESSNSHSRERPRATSGEVLGGSQGSYNTNSGNPSLPKEDFTTEQLSELDESLGEDSSYDSSRSDPSGFTRTDPSGGEMMRRAETMDASYEPRWLYSASPESDDGTWSIETHPGMSSEITEGSVRDNAKPQPVWAAPLLETQALRRMESAHDHETVDEDPDQGAGPHMSSGVLTRSATESSVRDFSHSSPSSWSAEMVEVGPSRRPATLQGGDWMVPNRSAEDGRSMHSGGRTPSGEWINFSEQPNPGESPPWTEAGGVFMVPSVSPDSSTGSESADAAVGQVSHRRDADSSSGEYFPTEGTALGSMIGRTAGTHTPLLGGTHWFSIPGESVLSDEGGMAQGGTVSTNPATASNERDNDGGESNTRGSRSEISNRDESFRESPYAGASIPVGTVFIDEGNSRSVSSSPFQLYSGEVLKSSETVELWDPAEDATSAIRHTPRTGGYSGPHFSVTSGSGGTLGPGRFSGAESESSDPSEQIRRADGNEAETSTSGFESYGDRSSVPRHSPHLRPTAGEFDTENVQEALFSNVENEALSEDPPHSVSRGTAFTERPPHRERDFPTRLMSYPGYEGWILSQESDESRVRRLPSESYSLERGTILPIMEAGTSETGIEPRTRIEPDTAPNPYSHGLLTANDRFGRILRRPSAPEFDSRAANGHDFLNRESAERIPIAGRVGSYEEFEAAILGRTRRPRPSLAPYVNSQGDISQDSSGLDANDDDALPGYSTPDGSQLHFSDMRSRSVPLVPTVDGLYLTTSPSSPIPRDDPSIQIFEHSGAMETLSAEDDTESAGPSNAPTDRNYTQSETGSPEPAIALRRSTIPAQETYNAAEEIHAPHPTRDALRHHASNTTATTNGQVDAGREETTTSYDTDSASSGGNNSDPRSSEAEAGEDIGSATRPPVTLSERNSRQSIEKTVPTTRKPEVLGAIASDKESSLHRTAEGAASTVTEVLVDEDNPDDEGEGSEFAEESIDYSNEAEVEQSPRNATNCPKVLIEDSSKVPEVKTLEVVIPSVRQLNTRSEPLLVYQWKLLKRNISQQLDEIERFIFSRKLNMTAQPTRFAAIMLQQHFGALVESELDNRNITEGIETFEKYQSQRRRLSELLSSLNATKTTTELRDLIGEISSQLITMVRGLVTSLSDVPSLPRDARVFAEQVLRTLRRMLLEIINNIRSSSSSEMSIGDNSDILDWEILLGRTNGNSRRFFFSRVYRTETLPSPNYSEEITRPTNGNSANTTPPGHG